MTPAATLESFSTAPLGRFLRGNAWIFGCTAQNLHFTLLGGRVGETDLRDLVRAYRVSAARLAPHTVLLDASRVEIFDSAAFELLLDYFLEQALEQVTRVAVVYGRGPAGAVFAGLGRIIPLAERTRTFSDTNSALDGLELRESLRAELSALAASLEHDPADLVRLRALLTERPHTSIAEAARTLGLAPRSLQRRLKQNDTTFQHELDHVRLDRAERALREDDRELGTLGRELGFASPQSFTEWFKSRTGETPGSFRRRHRPR